MPLAPSAAICSPQRRTLGRRESSGVPDPGAQGTLSSEQKESFRAWEHGRPPKAQVIWAPILYPSPHFLTTTP